VINLNEVGPIKWQKGRHSKYKHVYYEGKAICGSPAKALPEWYPEHVLRVPRCPECLRRSIAASGTVSGDNNVYDLNAVLASFDTKPPDHDCSDTELPAEVDPATYEFEEYCDVCGARLVDGAPEGDEGCPLCLPCGGLSAEECEACTWADHCARGWDADTV